MYSYAHKYICSDVLCMCMQKESRKNVLLELQKNEAFEYDRKIRSLSKKCSPSVEHTHALAGVSGVFLLLVFIIKSLYLGMHAGNIPYSTSHTHIFKLSFQFFNT